MNCRNRCSLKISKISSLSYSMYQTLAKTVTHHPLWLWSLTVFRLLNVPAAVTLTGLELYEPLVHRLQDGRIHLLHNVFQLVGIWLQVVDLHEWLAGQETKNKTEPPLSHTSYTSIRGHARGFTSLSANSQYCMLTLLSRLLTQA